MSASSGPVGSLVHVSGDAGQGCSVNTTWLGFDFEPQGGPPKSTYPSQNTYMEMTTPVNPDGTWSAEFRVPSYLGNSSGGHGGAIVALGRYRVSAKTCKKRTQVVKPFRVTSGAPAGWARDYVAMAVTADGRGYWLVRADGTVRAYGDARSYGSVTPSTASAPPIVGIARTYDAKGYWLVDSRGHVYDFGDAHSYGGLSPAGPARAPVTGIASTPLGTGYWLVSADGHVYGFGKAQPQGSPPISSAPYSAIEARPAGGYVVVSADNGGIYVYPGDALASYGPGSALAGMIVGAAVSPSGNGAWEAGLDGGVLTWGADAKFYGSATTIAQKPALPITAIAATPAGDGYWLLRANGNLFAFGGAGYFGAPGGRGRAPASQ